MSISNSGCLGSTPTRSSRITSCSAFASAATALHVSQPALSQQLEETLGAQLFDRTGRTSRLTDAGEVYFRYARRALQDLEEGKRAIHDVGDLSRGSLRVAVTPTFTTYLIGPLVESFHNLYPNVTLTVREMSQERIEELLVDDELDVGVAFDEIHSPDITEADRSLLQAERHSSPRFDGGQFAECCH